MVPRNKQRVRIIGGEWRSRTIEFPDRPGLRPTPDSVRETLFNWLAPGLYGTRVLDLCAGSGVLGLEALSRGAQEAVLLDSDRQVAGALHTAISKLAANAQVLNVDAREYLGETREAEDGFDVVFIDPPYESGLHATLCRPGKWPGLPWKRTEYPQLARWLDANAALIRIISVAASGNSGCIFQASRNLLRPIPSCLKNTFHCLVETLLAA